MRRRFRDLTKPQWVRKRPVGGSPMCNTILWAPPKSQTKEYHLVTLDNARELLLSGYAFDLVMSFLYHGQLDPDKDVDEKYVAPSGMDAGDLFRTLVLDARWDVWNAEVVYYAAMAVI